MTKKSFFIGLFLMFGMLSMKAQTVATYLMELESNTKWNAVSDQWKTGRDAWVNNCKKAASPKDAA